jgi:hypothetical protein
LLQGLLIYGTCGRRLGVRYTGNGGVYPIYQCIWKHREALARHACLTVPSKPLDDAIAERLLTAVTVDHQTRSRSADQLGRTRQSNCCTVASAD